MNQSPNHAPNEVVLALDFGLDRLDAAVRGPDGSWPIPHHPYANNRPGFAALKADVLAYLAEMEDAQLTAVGESTGLFWWHAFYQLATDPDFAPFAPQLALLNPAHVKQFRRALPERDKDDASDARLIARYYEVNGVKHGYAFDERYLPLRHYSRAYCRLSHTLAAEKAYFLSLLTLFASEYRRVKPFAEPHGVTSEEVLRSYPDVAAIAAIPLDDLAGQLDAWSTGHLRTPEENGRKLQQVARDSYPLAPALRPAVHDTLRYTLDHVAFLEEQKKRYQVHLEAELARLPEAELALAAPGLGVVLVGGLLGEIQDTRRFIPERKYDRKHKRWRPGKYRDGQAAVARLAGLWWPKNSSGRFEGQDRHLARERNPYLRHWLIQSAFCLKGQQTEYAAYYQKKRNEVTKHQHKRALVLTARKATRMIFALLHKGQMRRLEEEAAR